MLTIDTEWLGYQNMSGSQNSIIPLYNIYKRVTDLAGHGHDILLYELFVDIIENAELLSSPSPCHPHQVGGRELGFDCFGTTRNPARHVMVTWVTWVSPAACRPCRLFHHIRLLYASDPMDVEPGAILSAFPYGIRNGDQSLRTEGHMKQK